MTIVRPPFPDSTTESKTRPKVMALVELHVSDEEFEQIEEAVHEDGSYCPGCLLQAFGISPVINIAAVETDPDDEPFIRGLYGYIEGLELEEGDDREGCVA